MQLIPLIIIEIDSYPMMMIIRTYSREICILDMILRLFTYSHDTDDYENKKQWLVACAKIWNNVANRICPNCEHASQIKLPNQIQHEKQKHQFW